MQSVEPGKKLLTLCPLKTACVCVCVIWCLYLWASLVRKLLCLIVSTFVCVCPHPPPDRGLSDLSLLARLQGCFF